MAFPTALRSARKQWFQRTYAMFPNGNWNSGSEAICILDNGEVWLYVIRNTSMSSSTNWDEFGFSDFPGEGDQAVWIGKVTPQGAIRVSGDQLVYGDEILNLDTSWGWDAPRAQDTHLSRSLFNTTTDTCQMITDGTSIYIYQDYGVTGAPQWRGWYKLDPVTYEFHRMAGSANGGGDSIDSTDGSLASFKNIGQGVVHDGYIYFPSTEHYPGPSARFGLWTLRRMSLTPPYGVETVYRWDNPGNGYPYDPTGLANFAWMAQTNPNTGLLNYFNDDILAATSLPRDSMAMAMWDGYFYFNALSTINQGDVRVPFAIKRAPIEGGPLETIFWGIGNLGTNIVTNNRDTDFDSLEYPRGVESQHVWPTYNPVFIGQEWTVKPDLEGFWPWTQAWEVTAEGNLICMNVAPGIFAQGYNEYGRTMVKFHLPTMVAKFQADGPQRMDRANPQFDTIIGGTFMDEMLDRKQGWHQQRAWTMRDGHLPLMTHQEYPGIAVNHNHPDYVNKVMILQPVILPVINDANWGSWNTANAMFLSILEEVSGGEMKVRLQFNGTELKGYGAGPGMPAKYGPEQVTLT